MCGLAGVIVVPGGRVRPRAAELASGALSHRGPDAAGIWQEGCCTLLFRRLRIIDVSSRADQPMVTPHGERIAMVYNGEVYNFRELRHDLETQGASFSTSSDSEVLLRGYQRWGDDVFRRARGMWAAAFWHPDSQRLTLVRDPFGKKPLYYRCVPRGIVFASNLTALLHLLDQTPPVDVQALDCYLGHLVVPAEHTIFEGVRKVLPGTVVHWSPGGGEASERYWQLPRAPSAGSVTDDDALEAVLRQAVRRRLESDVPLGVFLSGGLDSGVVAALAAQESPRPLVAMTAGTVGSGYDERQAARLVAQRYGLQHHAIDVPAASATKLPMLLAELGEPFGDSSILPTYDVARVARQEITVALTGDGGDEAFFGYATFQGVRLAAGYRRAIPASVRRALWRWSREFARNDWRQKLGALLEYGALPLDQSFRNRMGFSASERAALLRDGRKGGDHHAEHVYADRLREWLHLPDADALRRTFYETFLPNDYLTKVDTATMAASLEARCPFLDVDVVEHILSVGAVHAFPGGRRKALLEPVARRLLPKEILRHPKAGFGVPVAQWMRGPLKPTLDEFVFRRDTSLAGLIDPEVARGFARAHDGGADHSTRLWGLLALGVWTAMYLDRRWESGAELPVAGA